VTHLLELLLTVPVRVVGFLTDWVAFNPKLGPLRHVATAAVAYVAFALVLVYVVAPIRGFTGQFTMSEKLRYDAERWLATAIYDGKGNFVGTFDPRLDSRRDVNYTDQTIEVGDYVANPDHKSIPVREVPEHYWQCLVHHEDRYIGGPLNPFGVDLLGVLKIPYSTVMRSIALKRPSLGVGGSTLPMQFARVIYKTPPHSSEGGFTKLRRKMSEWWLAPVIYQELTRGGDITPLKQWAANHLWLAQRTGGQPLHGVEVTSRIVFGKEAKDLSVAEQFVLASAVNKPIILMEGNETLNAVRLDRWRYITEVRARHCAERLLTDESEKKKVLFELINLAGGPPSPQVKPKLQQALDLYAPALAKRAQVNPIIRANALMPSARFGLREEMKQTWGFGWRNYVRGVTSTIDPVENLAFGEKVKTSLAKIDEAVREKISAGFSLDPARLNADVKSPNVVLVAANTRGEIVRYYEAGETAPYFGSMPARNGETGFYEPQNDHRMIASTGKIVAAIAIANQGHDNADTLYFDNEGPAGGLETCAKGTERRMRRALVSFACSLNSPLLNRTANVGQAPVRAIIDKLGFTMPPVNANGEGTPPSTAAVLGQISGSPRRVHQMSGVVLASLLKKGLTPVKLPSVVKSYDFTRPEHALAATAMEATTDIVPNSVVKRHAAPLLRTLLEAPLCYQAGGAPAGTLKALSHWCAARKPGLRLHFAKTGTQVTHDPNQTVDTWITGGLQFNNGAAYSYVMLVGTGNPNEPWATQLHAAQVAPLLETLLEDLAIHAKTNAMPSLLPPRPQPSTPVASHAGPGATAVASHSAARGTTAADDLRRSLEPR
jgi:membrane peptidoglycan carboxypeptidase